MNVDLQKKTVSFGHSLDDDESDAPRHVAIVMDGNRRYAKKKGIPTLAGHWAGANALIEIVSAADKLNIKILTVFGFSTENWLRTDEEIKALFEVLAHFLVSQRERMLREGVRLQSIGDISRLPQTLIATLRETEELTKEGQGVTLVLALSYGGRDEIVRAWRRMIRDFQKKKFTEENLDEALIASYLDTRHLPDPDLLIRTSGEKRVSNFLLWQMAYSELYFSEVLWPEFLPVHLEQAVEAFRLRLRRKGK